MRRANQDESSASRADCGTLLSWLTRKAPHLTRAYSSVSDWWAEFRNARRPWAVPIDQAIVGGVLADRVGYAFAAGYQSALRCMVPSLPSDRLVSFSVTEDGGGHPRAIRTTLRPLSPEDPSTSSWQLHGHKKWATLSPDGDVALVVGSTGTDPSGQNRLRVVQVPLDAPGVTVERMPETPFAPEISHGELRFDNVRVDAQSLLPGDGYTTYVKPFRTIEDTHVVGGILGHLLGVAARFDWPRATREDLLHLIVSLRTIGTSDPNAPETHIALGGFFTAFRCYLENVEPCWERVAPEIRTRWERDAGLVSIAGNVRKKRLEAAWGRVQIGAPSPSMEDAAASSGADR